MSASEFNLGSWLEHVEIICMNTNVALIAKGNSVGPVGRFLHQKLNSFTPFPSFTAYFTNSISQIIIHPKNMQFMERLPFLLS